MKKIILTMTLLGLFAVSCEKNDHTIPVQELIPRNDIELTRSQAEYVKTGGNEFALNLFKEVAGDENMVISPLSVMFALGMADNGASGNTKAEIEKVLGYGEESVEGLNSFFKTMLESIQEIDPSTKIEFANAAIVNSGKAKLKGIFKGAVETNYSAEVCNMEFGKDPVKDFINNWCNQKTNGMIPELLDKEPTPLEIVHLLNGVYFKGIWSSQFKKSDSKKEDLKDIYGKKHKVNMMHQEGVFNYTEIHDVCKVLSLPFGNQAFSMKFILPYEETIDDFHELKESFDLTLWNDISSNSGRMKVDVKIPSFEASSGIIDLKDTLQRMGIVDAFDPLVSRFDSLAEKKNGSETIGLTINKVLHKAKIKIDEQGSEAAAVTDVSFYGMTLNPGASTVPMIFDFHADRPFIYAITEVSTGAILFIGQYTGI